MSLPFTEPVHAPLQRIAQESPDRPFLLGEAGMTYGALERSTRALAQSLRRAHVAIGDRVVIWLSKQPTYVEAILATLRAGATYVPLDPNQPLTRVRAILFDAEPAVLITDRARFAQLRADGLPAPLRAVVLADGTADDESWPQGGPRIQARGTCVSDPTEAELPTVAPTDRAAILYTSGSTGIPKGVQLSHLNLANFIGWAADELGFGPDDVFSNHASFNFDLSTLDLFGALRAGGSLWVIPEQLSGNVVELAAGIRRHRVSVWYSVPSILALMVSSGALDEATAASLRVVLFAGEVYPLVRLRELKARLPEATRLYNLYGPTETNVCTFHRVEQIDPERTTPVPIGQAIRGASLSVRGPDGREVHGEEIGELVVSGTCVTPGYWRRTDPRNADHHLRGEHATGDLVSRDPDGALVYRGRKDRMVKIDGFRVELGEIEAALLAHASVREAAVVHTMTDERPRLIAFVAVRDGTSLSLLEAKSHCSARLPRYMVPHALRPMPALPKNPNGKIDYPALASQAAV